MTAHQLQILSDMDSTLVAADHLAEAAPGLAAPGVCFSNAARQLCSSVGRESVLLAPLLRRGCVSRALERSDWSR